MKKIYILLLISIIFPVSVKADGTFKIECDKLKLNTGESTTCTLKGKFDSELSKINVQLIPNDYLIIEDNELEIEVIYDTDNPSPEANKDFSIKDFEVTAGTTAGSGKIELIIGEIIYNPDNPDAENPNEVTVTIEIEDETPPDDDKPIVEEPNDDEPINEEPNKDDEYIDNTTSDQKTVNNSDKGNYTTNPKTGSFQIYIIVFVLVVAAIGFIGIAKDEGYFRKEQ